MEGDFLTEQKGYGYGCGGYGGFALLVVLFILLIIIGATCFY
ncbi:YjcZ family sporulation protein [Bacillus sp. Xin1]|nr:YjcZ family sporulation protein [Bacillus sp. Xin1]NSW37713.1 YjcZ family sporulation protein [Bacillus sp. Xin1]